MKWIAAVTALLAVTGALHAQTAHRGQLELGSFASFNKFDTKAVGMDQRFGAGGRLGVFLSDRISLEAGGDFVRSGLVTTGPRARVTRLSGSLLAKVRGGLYAGIGYERLYYRQGLNGDEEGVHLLLGNRLPLGGRTALRLEGRIAYFPNSSLVPGEEQAINFGLSAGLSVFGFGGPPRDDDRDGVANKRDRCPATKTGVLVDAVGCGTDADADGVFDGLDQCADTPRGAFVDGSGCPSDSDQDGVLEGIDVCPNTPQGAVVDSNGCPSDSDGDAVFDGIDACPDTPIGAAVDAKGCPTDEDGDSVFDGIDQCPGTPAGIEVDARGCPLDSDGDGVVNSLDKCPDTPPGTDVDADGCTLIRDSDQDGVNDDVDRCPNTPPGTSVDQLGCRILFQVTEGVVRPLVLKGVHFATNKATLTRESFVILDEVAASLIAHPEVKQIEIGGHTDATGSRRHNRELSIRRAISVKNYLVSKGVAASRLVSRGYGPDRPIATNRTRAGRAQNRRVELTRLDK